VRRSYLPGLPLPARSAGTCRPKSPSITRGTEGSNPSLSTGESGANLTPSIKAPIHGFGDGPAARFNSIASYRAPRAALEALSAITATDLNGTSSPPHPHCHSAGKPGKVPRRESEPSGSLRWNRILQ
jgi:hypothetical protein